MPEHPLAIYTDKNRINKKVGAAAVAPTTSIYTSAYLGKETTSTVYTAELVGILIGLSIAIYTKHPRAIIFTDNQAVLQILEKPGRQSGQDIVKRLVYTFEKARSQNVQVEFY
jgi:ribonuclease HI